MSCSNLLKLSGARSPGASFFLVEISSTTITLRYPLFV
jgi:hypothetical protein